MQISVHISNEDITLTFNKKKMKIITRIIYLRNTSYVCQLSNFIVTHNVVVKSRKKLENLTISSK